MEYSVEILHNNKVFIQPVKQRLRHGAIGKVIFQCNYVSALIIQMENL